MYRICRNEGFDDVNIHYAGGLWIWIQFNNANTCEAFKSNEALQNILSIIRAASPSFKVDERMVWIDIIGLPICAWGTNAFKKVASVFGKFRFFDSDVDDNMSLGRVCIAMERTTSIENDLDCNDSESSQDGDDQSCNMYENHNDVLADFIEQVMEQKVTPKSTEDVQDETNGVNLDRSDDIGSKPPDRKGFSFIDEMNSMIEVGGALGYDVKGYKRSSRKMFNGIGIQETKMTKLDLFQLKSMWGNFMFDYACSMARGKCLCDNDQIYLDSMVTLEEIKAAVWDYGSQKAPGPDGFSFMFVKKYWDLLHLDIQSFVNDFFASGMFLQVVAKILANRLAKVINSVISHEQSAFILSCTILDGPLFLSEVMDWCKKRKKKMTLFKVDVEKTFDSRRRLLNNPSALWVKVVKSIHGDEAGIDLKGCQTNGIWARIVGSIFHLHSSNIVTLNTISFKVGDGSLIRFWKDTWIGDMPFVLATAAYFVWRRIRIALLKIASLMALGLGVGVDKVFSSLSTDGIYSVNGVRKHIDDTCFLILSHVRGDSWLFRERLTYLCGDFSWIGCLIALTFHLEGWCDAKFSLLSSFED
nr:RNA-directed DNA polymerase, eukaryota, reverse transcriptase zinc-binding domain protein [Tanacetum cinerariifolium]